MITSGLGVGGSELQFCQVAIGLGHHGYDVSVIALRTGVYKERLRAAGIPVHLCPTGRLATPRQLMRLRGAIRRSRPDLVHTQAFRANLWGRLTILPWGTPAVASVRATYSYLPRAYYVIERLLSWRTARIITPSIATARYLTDVVGVSHWKVAPIPNGVELPASNAAGDGSKLRSQWNLDGHFVVLAAGRLVSQKNHAGLIEAFSRLARRRPHTALVIAGSGPLEAALRTQAAATGQKVVFAGELSRGHFAEALSAADAVCSMSEFEGMPNVLLEAMAAGRAVVATKVDGVPELIDDGVHGLLVAPGDVSGAADQLVRLVDSKQLRDNLTTAARSRVIDRHSVDVCVARHAQLYDEILGDRAETERRHERVDQHVAGIV